MNILFSDSDYYISLIAALPMPAAIYHGEDMTIVAANAAMLKAWGKDTSVTGMKLKDALPELDGQPFHKKLSEVYRTGTAYSAAEDPADLMINGKLSRSYFSFVYNPLKDKNGITRAIINTATDVTELVQARERISETEERLSLALSAAEIGTWDLDPINYTVKWDARCRELFGFKQEGEINYDDVLHCMHPDDEQRVHKAVLAAINPRTRRTYNIRYRTLVGPNKTVRWVLCKGKAYFNSEDIAYRFAGTAQDITAEVQFRRSEQQLLSLVENNADHMSVADLNGNLIYLNVTARKLLGVPDDENIKNFSAVDFYTADELERLKKDIIPNISAETGWQGTLHIMNHVTREVVPCHANILLIKDPETGEPIARGATLHDLRPELNARQHLAEKNAELQKTIKELEFLANSIPSVVWTSTPNGELDYINRRWYEHSDVPIEQSLGTNWAKTMHPDDMEAAWAAWGESLKTGNPYQIEFRLTDKKGLYRWWLVRALPLRNDNNQIIKWYGTNTDITDQKELQRQKDNFLGIASHELKTPVTSIKAYAQVMEMMFRRTGDEKNAGLVAKMDKQVIKLNNLIGDLLDVTKINSGRLQFNFEGFDFNHMVEEVIDDVQRTSQKHIIKAELNFKKELVGDRDRICQVVTNLLTNAIKYSPQSNEVIIYTTDKGDEVQLCVQDFGIGISPDKKDKVFEQFYRVSGSKEYTFPGLGLGLYISSEIIKRLGGKIWVNSVKGKGSTFCFSIPLKAVPNLSL